jgi:hypothetical protein
VHDLVKAMMLDRSRFARIWSSERAEMAGKADGRVLEPFLDGETRTRTGDTTIFRQVSKLSNKEEILANETFLRGGARTKMSRKLRTLYR